MRLVKYIAHAGVASRRAAEKLIAEGRVTVAGTPVLNPAVDVDDASDVAVDGRSVAGPQRRVTYALNKPVGVLSTARDTHGRKTVVDLLPDRDLRLYPVGRLDADSSGLILLTNDGELAHRLTHPSFHVPKTYNVFLAGGRISDRALRTLRTGVRLDDGPTAPATVRRISEEELQITIHEGRNRQVRRMCESVGHPVRRLRRVAIGPLELGQLPLGAARRLSAAEQRRLRAAAGL